jgi:NADPH2 dehydrogenase
VAVSEGIVQVKHLRSRGAFDGRLAQLGITDDLPCAEQAAIQPLLATPATIQGRRFANRFAVLPMEGWDATPDGRPTDLVRRRWQRFGASGAGLIWGGEAVAVTHEGRANPRQLAFGPHAPADLAELRDLLVDAHAAATGGEPAPLVGLQLTHSGRWSRPDGSPAPRTAYCHPLLDDRVGATTESVFTDSELDDLVGDFVRAAVMARDAGFDFVDVKHCHGYLLHELLSARRRAGRYGGGLNARLRFLDEVVEGVRRDAPELEVGVRLSAFDTAPFVSGPDGVGVVDANRELPYRFAFGCDGAGTGIDLAEPHAACAHLSKIGVRWVCITAGSPYYSPHIQRPAFFPPSDGYDPPRDPLLEVAQLAAVTRELAFAHPQLAIVSSGLTYLQEWLPSVGAALVRDGATAFVGYGRGALSYPTLVRDVVAGNPLERSSLCRTFSDCTTAPRGGLVSGCYPLDPFYKQLPERVELTRIKRARRDRRKALLP